MRRAPGPAPVRSFPGFSWAFVLLVALLALGMLACASGPPLPVAPGNFEPLAEGEGFLVIQVDTELAVERIDASDHAVGWNLQPGKHLWVVRMKSGSYRWSGVRLLAQKVGSEAIRPQPVGALEKKEFQFDVEAGAVNYPGEIVIKMFESGLGIDAGVSVRQRNHSAMAVRQLQKTHSALLAAHPIRYAGSSGDEFLQFYTRARDARASAKASAGGTKSGGGR